MEKEGQYDRPQSSVGAICDLEGVAAFDMPGYYRWTTPPAISGLMVTGINVPVRIGNATVMPGDLVSSDREGVTFIPPQSVQRLVDEAKTTHIHDEWTRKKFDEDKYKSTDRDSIKQLNQVTFRLTVWSWSRLGLCGRQPAVLGGRVPLRSQAQPDQG